MNVLTPFAIMKPLLVTTPLVRMGAFATMASSWVHRMQFV